MWNNTCLHRKFLRIKPWQLLGISTICWVTLYPRVLGGIPQRILFAMGYLFLCFFLAAGFGIIFGFLVLCFPASSLFCFSAFPASLLLCFTCFFSFLLLCFPCFFALLLLCFTCFFSFLLLCFSAFVLLCLSTSTIVLLFFRHVFLLLYFLLLCFSAFCLYCLFVFFCSFALLSPVCKHTRWNPERP